jgi:hypothetical protein
MGSLRTKGGERKVAAELNLYHVVFYNRVTRMEVERVTDIRAMNPIEAERIAWQEFDARHAKERYVTRDKYTANVNGAGS